MRKEVTQNCEIVTGMEPAGIECPRQRRSFSAVQVHQMEGLLEARCWVGC